MKRHTYLAVLALILCAAGCPGGEGAGTLDGPLPLAEPVTLETETDHPGLLQAVSDLNDVWQSADPDTVWDWLYVSLDDSTLAPQEYRLVTEDGYIQVKASSPIGASYALYHIAWDLGVRWYHPEEVYMPSSLSSLPNYSGEVQRPAFAERGFHEHTQHPTVWSDFYMRPEEPGYREKISNYLRWLLRNRQNAASYHMLNTIDLDTWAPWMKETVDEAHSYGIRFGVVTSFADQQQNNFKLITDGALAAGSQITDMLDVIAGTGVDFITFQIGTSEFTKPSDADVLDWLETAVNHLAANFPSTSPWASRPWRRVSQLRLRASMNSGSRRS